MSDVELLLVNSSESCTMCTIQFLSDEQRNLKICFQIQTKRRIES